MAAAAAAASSGPNSCESGGRKRKRKLDEDGQATASGSTSGSGSVAGDDEASVGEEQASSSCNVSGAAVASVLAHHVYGGARPGSLRNIYLRVSYTDGTRSAGFVPSESLGHNHKALLDYMSRRKEGAKIIKYLPPESQQLVLKRRG